MESRQTGARWSLDCSQPVLNNHYQGAVSELEHYRDAYATGAILDFATLLNMVWAIRTLLLESVAMKSEERRESYRIADISKATCNLTGDSGRFQGTLRNLSRAGFFLETDRQPAISETYAIEIVLEGRHSRLVVDNLSGVVTRKDNGGVAVEFSENFEWLVLAPIFF